MYVLHGTWIPHDTSDFVQSGDFYLWAEISEPKTRRKKKVDTRHPFQLEAKGLAELLETELTFGDRLVKREAIAPKTFLLPSADNRPLPSLELARYWEFDWPEAMEWQSWQIDCYRVKTAVKTKGFLRDAAIAIVKFLDDLQFVVQLQAGEILLGSDLMFWHRYSQSLKAIVFEDRYVPAIAKRDAAQSGESRTKKRDSTTSYYPHWQIVSEDYEANLDRFSEAMPLACACARDADTSEPTRWDKFSLLRHFSEIVINDIVTHAPSTQQFENELKDTLLGSCWRPYSTNESGSLLISEKTYQQWWRWYQKLTRMRSPGRFYLGFVLEDPGDDDPEAVWELYFAIVDRQEPSSRLLMADYWCMDEAERAAVRERFGEDLERQILVQLGYAARMYPTLWSALNRKAPFALELSLAGAFEFLTEYAWILEAAGFKAIVPAWWTPGGRRRAKLKLQPQSQKFKLSEERKSYFSADRLATYEYQFAIGDEAVEPDEWEQLLANQTPLVMFRGQWVELDPAKMKEMLDFWRSRPEDLKLSLLDAVKLDSQQDGDIELDLSRDRALSDLMAQLRDPSQLEVLPNPDRLNGTLREYQRRGLSWLAYLERLGLNGCLADDMGLGKTIQVIARLVQERDDAGDRDATKLPPTLLIVPTSVVGNWRHEIEKFAPQLSASIHHGGDRCQDEDQFADYCDRHDVIITSFTLARKDIKLLGEVEWHRVVLDEAQNIKNPKTAQTKAILKLNARHRLALTGTPVENRLMDLWSIFNFLNPGYLGKQTEFKRSFETPIQKHNDPRQAATLKKIVEPFILRRMKTDRDIIKDLPDKVEQKVYCNLTKEQAALYQT
ncbi:MAG: DEAD/DEAH box helicase, partial [Cyanobacteria bacterium J06639_1]